MNEQDHVEKLKKVAEGFAGERFEEDWEQVLKEDAMPWQKEAIESAFKMGFFEGLGYACKLLKQATEEESDT